jgi:hypothetical protein
MIAGKKRQSPSPGGGELTQCFDWATEPGDDLVPDGGGATA